MSAEVLTAVAVPIAQPLFVLANGRPNFACHHSPPTHLRRHAGVVLCPPLGYEYMSVYRTWRLLAERLAAIGFDVLRIDYDGTGNSAGHDQEPDRVDAWLRSVASAVTEVRGLSGSTMVALIGLRMGASLALQAAAAERGVQRLALWSPFAQGRAYVRELKAFARLSWQDQADEEADASGVINAAGHAMTEHTAGTLSRWSIDAITERPAQEVLLVERDDRPVDSAIETHLKALGTRVTTVRPEGTAEMLVPPQLATVPERVLDEITNWFGEWRVPVAVHAPRIETCSSPFAIGRAYREQAVRFGPDDRLFGILTSPSLDVLSAPAIILFNTAVEHHVGPHRLYVPLAREWAASGHLVLRFDLGGIGESAPPNGAPENVAYPDHMLDDAREAIAFLHEEAPGKPIILAGLCSGGWLAFQAARHGLPVDGIVSVNAPLYLRDGSAGRQWLTEQHELELYRDALRDRSMCVKELRGRDSYAMAARAVIRQIAVRVGGMFDGLPDGLSKDLAAIARRGIASLFIFSHGDDGLRYFQLHAAQVLRRPCVRDLVHHVVVEGAGHSFRPLAAQETLRTLMIDFVASQTGMTAARVPTPDHEVVAADDSL